MEAPSVVLVLTHMVHSVKNRSQTLLKYVCVVVVADR
jgi:hypothetical protein